jgi:hypothetical protein
MRACSIDDSGGLVCAMPGRLPLAEAGGGELTRRFVGSERAPGAERRIPIERAVHPFLFRGSRSETA